MNREELKEIIHRIVKKVDEKLPDTGCFWGDCEDAPPDPCDITTYYGMGEEG